jgi:hypothetical protein
MAVPQVVEPQRGAHRAFDSREPESLPEVGSPKRTAICRREHVATPTSVGGEVFVQRLNDETGEWNRTSRCRGLRGSLDHISANLLEGLRDYKAATTEVDSGGLQPGEFSGG